MTSLGAKHMSRVAGTLNGHPFRSNVVKMGGGMLLGVHKANVEALGLSPGDTVAVVMSLDAEPRGDDVPPEILAEALRRDPLAAATWDAPGAVASPRVRRLHQGGEEGRDPRPSRADARSTSSRAATRSHDDLRRDDHRARQDRPSRERRRPEPDLPWIVIVWNDPVNLMSYVTWVFQTLFGYPRAKAEKLMMDVHTKGKAVVSNGTREKARVRRRAPARPRPVGHDAEGRLRRRGARRTDQAHAPRRLRAPAARERARHARAGCADQLRTLLEHEDPAERPRDGAAVSRPRTRTTRCRNLEFERIAGDDLTSQRLAVDRRDGGARSTPTGSRRTRCSSWLGVLNDLRLVLGTRLDDHGGDAPRTTSRPDDPRAQSFALYAYLTWLVDAIVGALSGRLVRRGLADGRPDPVDLQHVRGGLAGG